MSNDMEYVQAIEQASANLADARERDGDALGESWEDLRSELLTPEEIAASNIRVAIMVELTKARHDKNISQLELEALSGVRQPIISRMESGSTSPKLDTILKVLWALGKTLRVCDISENTTPMMG